MRNITPVVALLVGLVTACTIQETVEPASGTPASNAPANPSAGDRTPAAMGTATANGSDPARPAAGTKIRFGVAPQSSQTYSPPTSGPANVDAVVVGDWLVENGFTSVHETKITQILAAKKTPYLFCTQSGAFELPSQSA